MSIGDVVTDEHGRRWVVYDLYPKLRRVVEGSLAHRMMVAVDPRLRP